MSGESGFNQEIGDANNAYNFGDSDGDIDRKCNDHARVGANNGEPGNSEKDGPRVRKMSHGTARAQ
jgi:hypothetical protein